jgi:hypothetical protein
MLGIDKHTAELVDFEHTAGPAEAFLLEQNGSLGVDLDGNGCNEENRGKDHQNQQGQNNIEKTF